MMDGLVKATIANYEEFFDGNNGKALGKAFLLQGVANYLDIDVSEAVDYITDGGGDLGIDAIDIEEHDNNTFSLTFFQAKYTQDFTRDSHFSENAVRLLVDSVGMILNNANNITIANPLLAAKIAEIRSLELSGKIAVAVNCVCLSNGIGFHQDTISYLSLVKNISFLHFSHIDILNNRRSKDSVNASFNLQGVCLVDDGFDARRIVIGRINVRDIAELLDTHNDSLLQKNIRHYLGKNKTNQKIAETLLSENNRNNFYFLNNGVTMVCNRFFHNGFTKENTRLKVEGLNIINGGQTCRTIQEVINANKNSDFNDTSVMVRIYEIGEKSEKSEQFIYDITVATNSQTAVDMQDLRSNEAVQQSLAEQCKQLGYVYKLKKNNQIRPKEDTIAVQVAAEAVMSVWRKRPHIAKFQKKTLFDAPYYSLIFDKLNAAQLIIAVLVFRYADNQRRNKVLIEKNAHLPYSNYYMAMLMGRFLLENNQLNLEKLDHTNFTKLKAYFEENKTQLFEKAKTRIGDAIRQYFQSETPTMESMAALFRDGDFVNRISK